MIALLLLALAMPAQAEPTEAELAPWYVGQQVALVTLESTQGELPPGNFEPLLAVRQNEPLSLGAVRQDINLLQQTGAFASIEAHAEPWFAVDEEGEPYDAIWLVYRVEAAPRVASIELEGARGELRQRLLNAAGVHEDDVFYRAQELGDLERRLSQSLADGGWRNGRATVKVERILDDEGAPTGEIALKVKVRAGEPERIEELRVAGDLVWGERKTRRLLRRKGVKEGERLDADRIRAARASLRDELVAEGWLQARVSLVLSPGTSASLAAVEVLVDAGERLEVRADDRSLPRGDALQELLGIFPGDRLGPGMAVQAEERLLSWYDRRGFLDAKVEARLVEVEDGVLLDLHAVRGPRHVLGRIEVEGATVRDPNFLAGVMREADPDSLGQGRVSRQGLKTALEGVRQVYRGQGYLDARLTLLDVTPIAAGPLRLAFNRQPNVVRVHVSEGEQTRLIGVDVDGEHTLAAGLIAQAREDLVGRAYDAPALERVAQQIVDRYRAKGYLSADAEVGVTLLPKTHEARATLYVRPGTRLQLRGLVISGNRYTRRKKIEEEIAVRIGDALSPMALAQTRSRLYELDLFRVVDLELVGEGARYRDLVVRVAEKPRVQLQAGAGASTDLGVRSTARALHRNLFGLGHRATGYGQLGLAWQGERWAIDRAEPVWRTGVSYEAPGIPVRGFRLVLEALLLEAIREPTYRISRSGVSAGLRWKGSGDRTELLLDYRVQWRRLQDVDKGALVLGDPWLERLGLDGTEDAALTLPSEVRPVSGMSLQLVHEALDDPFKPREGVVASGLVEVWDGLVGRDPAIRAVGQAERLQPVGPVVISLALRGGLGWAGGRGRTLALEDRFLLGGPSSLRGFRLHTVGPANFIARPEIDFADDLGPLIEGTALREEPAHWVTTGGDSMVGASLELRVPTGRLGLPGGDDVEWAVFTDVGRVGFLDPVIYTTSTLEGRDPVVRIGIGTGIRLSTPVGPAAFDVGFNPWRLTERDEPLMMLHLSLGSL